MITILKFIFTIPIKIYDFIIFILVKIILFFHFIYKLLFVRKIYSLKQIDKMDGYAFEEATIQILKKNHFTNIQATPLSQDYGVDILCEKDGICYAIQCKNYQKNVGVEALQQAISGCIYYEYDIPVVLTNSYFTRQAKELSRQTEVELWDRDILENLCERKRKFR